MGFLRNRITAVGCVVAAAGLAAGGCSGSGRHSPTAGATTAGAPVALEACSSTFLAMSAGHRSGTTMVTQAVNLTNNGTTACVLNGYPGVNLIGRAHGQSQYTWTLRWAKTPHSPVTLEPGATAHFDVVYRPAAGDDDDGTAADPTMTATAGAMTTAKPTAAPGASAKASAQASAASTGKATGTGMPTAKGTATAGKGKSPVSAPVDIDVLDITITLPNTFSQDQMAWYADLLLQDNDANAQTHVTPIVAGAA